jgi:plasmid stabilization system protein ParE
VRGKGEKVRLVFLSDRAKEAIPFEHRYLIVYRPMSDGVLIVRFLHGARDIEKLL